MPCELQIRKPLIYHWLKLYQKRCSMPNLIRRFSLAGVLLALLPCVIVAAKPHSGVAVWCRSYAGGGGGERAEELNVVQNDVPLLPCFAWLMIIWYQWSYVTFLFVSSKHFATLFRSVLGVIWRPLFYRPYLVVRCCVFLRKINLYGNKS